MTVPCQRGGLPACVCWIALLGSSLALPAGPAQADEAWPAAAGEAEHHHHLRLPSGVEIDVKAAGCQNSPQAIADALEQAARQIRLGNEVSPATQVVKPAALDAAEAAPPPAALADPGACCLPSLDCAPVQPEWLGACHGDWCFGYFPPTLLWQPPLANLHEPRMSFLSTNLENASTRLTIDTSIGATIALLREAPCNCPGLLFQQDVFAVVQSRFSNNTDYVASDFRFGFPFTAAWNNWSAKIAYEHTSTHLGDDLVTDTGREKRANIRDELVLGLAYRFGEQVRVYGQWGYASSETPLGGRPNRFDCGVEWSRQRATGSRGQPFAALDLESREEQDFDGNTSLQFGWQWQGDALRPSFRVAVELYDGRSHFGQLFQDREQYAGIGLFLDY